MTTAPDRDVRSFREVGIVLSQIRVDIEELKDGQKRLTQIVLGSLLCPLFVGVVLGYLFN